MRCSALKARAVNLEPQSAVGGWLSRLSCRGFLSVLWKEGAEVREMYLEVQAFLRFALMLDAGGEILLCVALVQYFKKKWGKC